MSDAVGITGVKSGTAQSRPSAASSAESAGEAFPTVSATTGTLQFSTMSPRLVTDATTGVVITQFLGTNGAVQTQLPSAAAVAYLRVGLTATGEAHPDPVPGKADKPGTILA